MRRYARVWPALSLAMVALVLGAIAAAYCADDDDEEIPFDVANIFFELNDTDGDLGIHALVDGDPWKMLALETPDGRQNLLIRVGAGLRRQGLTELFFESAEPTFSELSPEKFFRRFPEGEYEVEGLSLDGEEMESTDMVTHLLPAPVEHLSVNGMEVPEECDGGPVPVVSEPFLIRWDPVDRSHPDLGRRDEPITVVRYQLVLEREEPLPLEFSLILPPSVTEVLVPAGLAGSGERIKIEVLVREDGGNQTAVESCFDVN